MARLIFLFLIAVSSLAAQPAAAADDYAAMVARVKGGDANVDYRALREAYAASAAYAPYGGDFDDAVVFVVVEPGGLGIENDLSHKALL